MEHEGPTEPFSLGLIARVGDESRERVIGHDRGIQPERLQADFTDRCFSVCWVAKAVFAAHQKRPAVQSNHPVEGSAPRLDVCLSFDLWLTRAGRGAALRCRIHEEQHYRGRFGSTWGIWRSHAVSARRPTELGRAAPGVENQIAVNIVARLLTIELASIRMSSSASDSIGVPRVEDVVGELRTRIAGHEIAPGSRLKEHDLASEFGVPRSGFETRSQCSSREV